MPVVGLAAQFVLAYKTHLERLIAGITSHHHETIRRELTPSRFAEQIGLVLAMKSDQAREDGEYHNAVIGGPTIEAAAEFIVFEVGCTPSLRHLKQYWHRLGYDGYKDYVVGILCNEGKGFDLYSQMTGQLIADEPTEQFVRRFITGHVFCDLEQNILLMTLLWPLPDGQVAVFPPDLLGNHMIISREEIEAQLCEDLLRLINANADNAGTRAAIQGSVTFTVGGYDSDPRELFEIPEVKSYFRKLDKIAPHFLFFIANEKNGWCVRLFVKMFIEPEFFSTPNPSPALTDQFSTFILTRLNCVADYCAQNSMPNQVSLDPVTTVHQTFRSCGCVIDRSEAQTVLDAR